MSSSYSSNLRVELIGSGDQAGTWGTTTDNNFAYIFDAAIAGYQAVTITSTSQLLTSLNGPTSSAALNQSVYAILKFNSASAATNIFAPPVSKQYIIWNNSGYAITIYNSAVINVIPSPITTTGVTIANGNKVMVWSDGTNFYEVQAQNLTGTLPIANGGTGQVTANAAFNALAPAQTSTVTAGSFVVGATYTILTVGTTNFVSIGASASTVGITFVATGVGSGNGTATTTVPNRYLKSDGTNTSFDYLNLADVTTVTAGSFVIGTAYTVKSLGTTNFVAIGATSSAVVTGSVATTVLTVATVSSGTLAVGTYITGTNVNTGTYIVSFGTGTGGAGTYNLNQISTASSTTITGQPAPGAAFIATGVGSGTGTAVLADYIGVLPVSNGGTGVGSLEALGNLFYPVGSIYTNATVATNPGTLLGFGTWATFGSGRMLISQDVTYPAGTTGGSATTTLITANLPSHSHSITDPTHTHPYFNMAGSDGRFNAGGGLGNNGGQNVTTTAASTGITSTNNTGSGTAATTISPYISVYMWQRTA
jgi:hypothetical protein